MSVKVYKAILLNAAYGVELRPLLSFGMATLVGVTGLVTSAVGNTLIDSPINEHINRPLSSQHLPNAYESQNTQKMTKGHAGKLVYDAKKQIGVTVSYDPSYQKLEFPRGDVSQHTGVCTDVVVRAYRLQNIDLQQLINQDMRENWSAYPKIWGLKKPDSNIDHRRVPNLEVFFKRHGQNLATDKSATYKAGDIVTWRLPNGNLPHIGIVSDKKAPDGTPLIIHNIGRGTQQENILFAYPIHGHYRY